MDNNRNVTNMNLSVEQINKFWNILKFINFPSVDKMNIENVTKLFSILGRDLLYKWILSEIFNGKTTRNFEYFFKIYGICSKSECLTFMTSEKLDVSKQIEILNKTFLILLLHRRIDITKIADLLPDLYPNYKKFLDKAHKLSICSLQVANEIRILQKYSDDLLIYSEKYPQLNITNIIVEIDDNITKMSNICNFLNNNINYFIDDKDNNYDMDNLYKSFNNKLPIIIKHFQNLKDIIQHIEEMIKVYNNHNSRQKNLENIDFINKIN